MTDLQSRVLSVSRIFVGFAFWTHGAQKLLGWFGGFGQDGGTVELMSRFGIAGTIEFFGGLLLIFGLFTRPVAFIVAGEMAVAYWWMHTIVFGGGIWLWANRGELVMVYCFVWLIFAALGGGSWSLDALRAAKKGAIKSGTI